MSSQELPLSSESKISGKNGEKSKTRAWWQSKRTLQVGAVCLLIAGAGAVTWWIKFRPFVSTDDARVAMTLVRVAPSGVSGRIDKVNVVEGTRVKAGDVLVEIDHRVPQANFERAKSRFDLSKKELNRMQRLTSEGSTTPQALDQVAASSASAEAEWKLAEVVLENTTLKSPFDGIVIQKLAEVGNLLEQNQAAIVVADEAHAWIAANIEETAIGTVRLGQTVEIKIDEGGMLEGKVSEIRTSVASQFALIPSDSGAGNFTKVVQRVPIKVEISNRDKKVLRAGQSVEIKIRVL